jgi:hypothetical protein
VIALIHAVQRAPASTWGTFHAGYTVAAVIYVGYALSLWMRGRRYRRAIGASAQSRRG